MTEKLDTSLLQEQASMWSVDVFKKVLDVLDVHDWYTPLGNRNPVLAPGCGTGPRDLG